MIWFIYGTARLQPRPAARRPGRRPRGVAGGQGVGVSVAQHPLAVGEGALEQRDGLVQPPGGLVGGREVIAGGQGVGVASPRTRSRSARVRSNSEMALSSRPAAW